MQVLLGLTELPEVLERAPRGEGWLGAGERERLAALAHPGRRAQFLAGRALARELLVERGGGQWHDWSVERDARGAPCVLWRGEASALQLSLAHSGSRIFCAVAECALGVDVEQPARERNFLELADALYPAEFAAALAPLDGIERRRRFFQRWTLDEALAKASGDGLQPKALRQRHWLDTGHGPAQAWTWELPDGWLALALRDASAGVPRFCWHSPPGLEAPQSWRCAWAD